MREIREEAMDINFSDVLRLDEVYKNFVKNVIANNRIWFLFNDGRVAVAETETGEAVALWSSEEAATKNKAREWSDFCVKSMSVAEFFVLCLPDFIEDDVNAMVEMGDDTGIWKNMFAIEDDLKREAEAQGIDFTASCAELESKVLIDANYMEMLHRIVRERCAWALINDGNLAMGEFEGEDAIPLWASEEAARAMASEEWAGCEVDAIPLEELLEELLPMLAEDEVNLLFSTDDEGGLALDAETLAEDLREIMREEGEEADFDLDGEIDLSNVIPFPKLQ